MGNLYLMLLSLDSEEEDLGTRKDPIIEVKIFI
jgi:hypothetical protein